MKLNINSAKKGVSSFKFSPMTLTTLDFGRLQPLRVLPCFEGVNYNVSGKGLLRCTPQVFPPFGRMNVKNASFFVPDSQIFSWSTAFHADQKLWRGQPSTFVPTISASFLNTAFLPNVVVDPSWSADWQKFYRQSWQMGLSTLVADNPVVAPARNTYDFVFPSVNGSSPAPTGSYGLVPRASGRTNLVYCRLTPLGWKMYSIFKALGYDFISYPTDFALTHAGITSAIQAQGHRISAVPFLAYAKIWNDYFCNSYQSDNSVVSEILQNIYLGKNIPAGTGEDFSRYTETTGYCSSELFKTLLVELQLPYESDMYTNAWNNVNDPTGTMNAGLNQTTGSGLISPFDGSDGTNGGRSSLVITPNGTSHSSVKPVSPSPVNSTAEFTEQGHKVLAAFDKFVRRRNLVGSKAIQQIYAMFGIMPNEWGQDYVAKLSEGSNRVSFSAITSTSDTVNGANGSPLGAFAGTGMSGYDINFNYKADTHGTIICLAWLNIEPIRMHGMSADVLRINPLDFYHPDFDGKAYRPIPYCEIQGAKSIEADGFNSKSIYGYTNIYDDYRNMNDVVCGNFLDDTTRHFAFMRDLTETRNSMASFGLAMKPQSEDVQYWHIDGNNDLTNPFITDASEQDRFWFCVDWNISAQMPILGHEDSFDLDGSGSVGINKNGNGMA